MNKWGTIAIYLFGMFVGGIAVDGIHRQDKEVIQKQIREQEAENIRVRQLIELMTVKSGAKEA